MQRKNEEEDEILTCKPKALPEFRLQNSLTYDGKCRTNLNSSEPIHSLCNIATMTQEGRNAARKWNEKTRYSRESSAKKENKSRKERQASTREKHGGTDKARALKVKPPYPTLEAVTGVQLR